MKSFKHYLGDGVYADWDGHAIILTTEDGVSITNRIVLEDSVYQDLNEYMIRLNDKIKEFLNETK